MRAVRGGCDVVDVVNEGRGGGGRAGEGGSGGGKTEGESRNSGGVRNQVPQR